MAKDKLCVVGRNGRQGRMMFGLLEQKARAHGAPPPIDLSKDEWSRMSDESRVTFWQKLGVGGAFFFTNDPDSMVEQVVCAAQAGVTCVIGTTGLLPNHLDVIKAAAIQTRILQDFNFSVGANSLMELARLIGQRFPNAAFQISDIHHQHKKDAPSGTAKRLQEAIILGAGANCEVAIHSSRGGSVIGVHEVTVLLNGEHLTLGHHADTPDLFVQGALRGYAWLCTKENGLYTMKDVLA